MATASLLPAIAGYRLDRVLRQDETGVVYLAEDLARRRFVRLRVLAPELARRSGFATGFLATAGSSPS